MPVVVWSDEATSQLRALVAQGLTSRDIAKALGGITRNAVIGKMNRLGLSPVTGKMNRLGLSPVTPLPAPAKEEPLEGNQTYLMGLKNFMCRFPVSGSGDRTLFCGDPTEKGSCCPDHRKRVFVPKTGVKRDGEEVELRKESNGFLPDSGASSFRFGAKIK